MELKDVFGNWSSQSRNGEGKLATALEIKGIGGMFPEGKADQRKDFSSGSCEFADGKFIFGGSFPAQNSSEKIVSGKFREGIAKHLKEATPPPVKLFTKTQPEGAL